MNCQNNMRISCIIPTANRPQLALRAIDSVLNQTYPVFEIIVVDDFSDQNFTLPNNDKYKKVKIIRSNNKIGGARARNLGMKYVTGDYFCFLDDDDEYIIDKFENLISLFHLNPSIEVAVGDTKIFDIKLNKFIKEQPDSFLDRYSNAYRNKVHTNSTLISSKLLNKISFLETLDKFQDTQFNTELIYRFNYAYANKFVSVWYTSWSSNQITSQRKIYFNFINKLRILKYFSKNLKMPLFLMRHHCLQAIKYFITLK